MDNELFPGIESMAVLLAVLKSNPAAAAQIKHMQNLADEIALATRIKGTAEDIDRLHREGLLDRDLAHRELVLRKVEEDEQRARLEGEQVLFEKNLGHLRTTFEDECNEIRVECRLREDTIQAAEQALATRRGQFDEREVTLRAKEELAEQTIADYRRRTKALKELAAKV